MKNEEIIKQVLEIYFQGSNWQRFLKEQVKRRSNNAKDMDKVLNKMDVAEKKFKFNKGQKIKTKRMEWTTGWDTLITKGKVIMDNKYFTVIDNGNYKTCVNKVDLYTKSVVLA
ncbi:hypothetical protein DP124_01220 [Clostridium tetani]|uniref:hypothetical protein n=1 Tax=Clostridium tetani TaxID=1513 RepID=UPI00100AF0A8|nr:hypothetical protein [Clostridium tetani]RXI55520.1 hypothetical protein DP124_01220 [Clostridium tetani]RXM70827.1 hypothetical protein DP143_13745 [Clostridium tetani]